MQSEGMGKPCISNNLYWPTKGNFYNPCSSSPAPLCVRKALQEMSGYISAPATGFLSPPTSVLLIFPWSTALSLTSTALLTVSSTKYYWYGHRRSHEPILESIQEDRKDITMSESILGPLDGAQHSQRSASTSLHNDWKWRINIYPNHAINIHISNLAPVSAVYFV